MSDVKSPCGKVCAPVVEGGVEVRSHRLGRTANIVQCGKCGYRVYDPIPDPEFLGEYYGSQYWPEELQQKEADAIYSDAFGVHYASEFRRIAADYGINLEAGRLHDVGCSFGGVVNAVRKVGLNATGSDLSQTAVATGRSRGNEYIETAPLKDWLEAHNEKIDMFFMSHSLEHIPDPAAELRLMRDALAPGGAVVVRVPNGLYLPMILRHMASFHWLQYPDHIHYFTPKSLDCLFKSAGLRLIEVKSLVRDDTPDVVTDALFGRHWRDLPDVVSVLNALSANLMTCELQAVAVHEENNVAPQANLAHNLEKLGDEVIRPTQPVVGGMNSSGYVAHENGGDWSYTASAWPTVIGGPLTRAADGAWWLDSDGCVVAPNRINCGINKWTQATYGLPNHSKPGIYRIAIETFSYHIPKVPFKVVLSVNENQAHEALHVSGETHVSERFVRLAPSAKVMFSFGRVDGENPGQILWNASVTPVDVAEFG
jgi:SAM-dependent methyltransferase